MREIGRQRRLRGKAAIGLAAAAAIAVGGSLAASQAVAAPRTPAAGGGLSVTKQFFGSTVEPYTGKNTAVFRYTLRNANGMQVQILTYGGIVQDIWVPGRNGHGADVVLGFKTLKEYVTRTARRSPRTAARTSARPSAGTATGSPRAPSA